MGRMLEVLFGSRSAEQVLLYLENYGEGFGKAMADTYGVPLSVVQKQLVKFESAGVLVSQLVGRTRVYRWNPRYPFLKPLRALLRRAFDYLPEAELLRFYRQRRRPQLAGKP
jgi:hypothetical protein